MSDKKTGVVKKAAPKFDPKNLTKEQQEAVVEEYLGVHPKYFMYKGINIRVNRGKHMFDGYHFNGFKPKSYKYNSFEG